MPLLLSIHGGPMSQYGNAWFDEFQLWAGAGLRGRLLQPARLHRPHRRVGPRRSARRRPTWRPGTGWGGIDADDVLAVLDAALDREPVLDRDRVGVLGGSYGGYLTSWLVGHTDRFAAACSERAVNNMESEEWTSDAGGLVPPTSSGVTHLDAPEVYRRISPITYVRDITTPLLILHSEDDLRCHVEQADQLFVALRLLGQHGGVLALPRGGPRALAQRLAAAPGAARRDDPRLVRPAPGRAPAGDHLGPPVHGRADQLAGERVLQPARRR